MAVRDRGALMMLLLLGSMIGNLLLLSQLFVWRPEYLAEQRIGNAHLEQIEVRLARIERRMGINQDPPKGAR